jgi:hypothetical protein
MKNRLKIILMLITALTISAKTFAQDSLRVKAGLTLVPVATINPKNISGFNAYQNMLVGITTIKKKWFNTTFYSVSFNQYGTAIGYSPNKLLTGYLVYARTTTKSKTDYAGIGFGTPLANGRATGFVEFGSNTYTWSPACYIGMFIPFTVNLR